MSSWTMGHMFSPLSKFLATKTGKLCWCCHLSIESSLSCIPECHPGVWLQQSLFRKAKNNTVRQQYPNKNVFKGKARSLAWDVSPLPIDFFLSFFFLLTFNKGIWLNTAHSSSTDFYQVLGPQKFRILTPINDSWI